MSSRQLSNLTLDRLEESLSRFYLQERSSSTTFSTGSSGSSRDSHHHFKLTATETKVVQETTHREVVLESYTENGQNYEDSDADSYDDGPQEQEQQPVCYEVPSVEVVGYSESSHRYDEKEYYSYEEHQGSAECYEEPSGYDGGYDGGYELDLYGGQSDYDGYYYDQGGYGDYY